MNIEMSNHSAETLPNHVAIGLRDGVTRVIDEYVDDVNERLDEAVAERSDVVSSVEGLEAIAAEHVVDEVAEKVAEALDDPEAIDVEEIEREFRRRKIIAAEQHKRRFARPILSYATIYYPPSRY